jgi:hypothetical protein
VIRKRRSGDTTPRCLARFSGDGAETLWRFASTPRVAGRWLDGVTLRFAGATDERPAAPRVDVAVPRTGVCDEDRRCASARRVFVELAVRLEFLLGVERRGVARAERLAARSC